MNHAGVIGAALVALGCIGCGGGDGVSCEFADCGGDPTGNWQVEGVCGDFSALTRDLEDNCAGLEVSYDFGATGSVSFNANNTYAAEMEIRVDITASFPAACIAQTGATTCSQLTDGFDGDAVCSGAISDGCDCEFSDVQNTTETGDWAVNGDVLLIGGEAQTSFCQDGDTMHLQTIADQAEDPTVIYVFSRN